MLCGWLFLYLRVLWVSVVRNGLNHPGGTENTEKN